MQISEKGIDFLVREEGYVSKAYRDVTGTWTIGTGFTNGSRVAVAMLGRPIAKGMVITREQNDRILREAIATEYGPPVQAALPNAKQHEYDGAVSYVWNCGTGATKDSWFKLLRAGKVAEAASALKRSRITSKGKRLTALINRRSREAKLIQYGIYDARTASNARSVQSARKQTVPDELLREYQQKLADLGYYHGAVDGWHGPKTTEAVLEFQKTRADLVDDGIIGKATRAAIDRDINAKAAIVPNATVAGIGATGTAQVAQRAGGFDWSIAWALAGVVALVVLAYFVIRYRTEIAAWIKSRSWGGSFFRLFQKSKTLLFAGLAMLGSVIVGFTEFFDYIDWNTLLPETWLPYVTSAFSAAMIYLKLRGMQAFDFMRGSGAATTAEVDVDDPDELDSFLDHSALDDEEDDVEQARVAAIPVARPETEPLTLFYVVKKNSQTDQYAAGGKTWTRDIAKAMRFAREEDAQRFKDTTFGKRTHHTVEHFEEALA